ncbi:APC family permease [Algoriphagus sp.]|uniref:APC family permease n=1 Tax=Algoriphagus sp. TaxID=1872435 RepID=UPI0025CE22F6|nr:APC family permease [Algoriphagus sp.]
MKSKTDLRRPQLHRGIGKAGLFSLAFGAMIGVGWVTAMGSWLSNAGPLGAIIAFFLGGLIILVIGICYAEVTAALPLSGGEVAYAYKAFGSSKSFIVGWFLTFGYLSVSAFEAVSINKVLSYLIPSIDLIPIYSVNGSPVYLVHLFISAFFVVLISAINYTGVKNSARFQVGLTILFVLLTFVFVIAGFIMGDFKNLTPLFSGNSTGSITAGIAMVLVTVPFWFVGFDTIPQAAEEADQSIPFKTIGSLILVSIIAAICFYMLLILSTSTAAPWNEILDEKLPTASAFEKATESPFMVKIILITALVGLLTSWNGFFLAGSRVLFALGRGKIISPQFGKSHPTYHTPYKAVLFSGLITFLASLMGQGAMVAFVNVGSLCIVIAFFGVSFSFLSLRKKFPNLNRPFFAPKGRFLGILSICGTLCMLIAMLYPGSPAALAWPLEWVIFSVFSLLGFIFWKVSSKSRNSISKEKRDYLILDNYS